MNTPQPLQLTDRARPTDGEDCVYCGQDSWTCEHFEPQSHEDIEDARREAMLDAQAEYEMQRESEGE